MIIRSAFDRAFVPRLGSGSNHSSRSLAKRGRGARHQSPGDSGISGSLFLVCFRAVWRTGEADNQVQRVGRRQSDTRAHTSGVCDQQTRLSSALYD